MVTLLREHVRLWARCRRGNFALITAVMMPLLAGTIGGVVDLAIYHHQVEALQDAADAAALAATREASLKGWSQETAEAVVDLFIATNYQAIGQESASFVSDVEVDEQDRTVSVTIEQDHYGYFVIGYFKGSPQIRVNAVAQTSGATNVCVIGLDPSLSATISLDSNSILSAPNCAVYSNSASTSGMQSLSNSVLTASLSCTAGGFAGSAKNFSKAPLTDCPIVEDPLADRPPPPVSTRCEAENLVIKEGAVRLREGVYCGGLTVDSNARVTMSPGIYVIKDGPFVVDSNAAVNGTDVGLYFTGRGARFLFTSNAVVNLEALTTGNMAGLLVFQNRAAANIDFEIKSNYTRNLLGTIYLPNGNLIVDANNPVADRSAYTALVVRRLRLFSGPNLALNTNYNDTDVPVPEGVGPTDGPIRLLR